MRRYCWQALAALLLALGNLAAAPQPPAPVAVLTVKSTDALLADLQYLAPFVGDDESAAQIKAFLRLPGDQGLEGVDRRRPLGAYLHWPKKLADLTSLDLPVVSFVPVTDPKQFLKLLETFGCQPRKAGQGLYRLTVPGGPDLSLRFAHGYAYAATRPGLLAGQLADPATLVPADGGQGTLALRVFAERIPRKAYERLVEELLDVIREEAPAELRDEAQFEMLRLGVKAALLVPLLDQLREITLTLDVDRKQHRLALDVALVPRPDSTLSRFGSYAGEARSRFRTLGQGAALSAFVHFPAVGADKALPPGVVEQAFAPLRGMVDAPYREVIAPLIEIGLATLASDGFDAGLSIPDPLGGAEPPGLVGLKVQQGRKLDHLLRDTVKNLPAAERSQFSFDWNHARHGKARIHRLKIVGEELPSHLAIRDDVVFFGWDKEGGLKLVEAGLDRFDRAQAAPAPTPLFQLDVAPGKFLSPEQYSKLVSAGVPRLDREALRAQVRIQGGTEVRLHAEMHTHVLGLLRRLGEDEGK
jgi:hypothetical protein